MAAMPPDMPPDMPSDMPQKSIPGLSPQDEKTAKGQGRSEASAEEAKQFSSGLSTKELKDRAYRNEADRTEYFRDHFERLSVITLYVAWVLLLLAGIFWAYHLILPKSWHFLDPDQSDKIQTLLTGSILAGITRGHTKRRLDSEKKNNV